MIIVAYGKQSKTYRVIQLVADVSGALVPNQNVITTESEIVNWVSAGYIPLNFSVLNGKIKEDWGAFERFNNIPCFVILSEIISQSGRPLGYRIYDIHSDTVSNVQIEQIKEHIKTNPNVVLFQNAIIKNKSVYSYPNKEFLKMMVGTASTKPAVQKKPTKHAKSVEKVSASAKKGFSPKQLEVIQKAKENGIKGSWLSNPDISAKQMNLLCRAKAKGALAEYFADPRMEADHIDFWADRLYDEKLAQDCKPLLKRPDIPVEPLTDLFDCAVDGTKYDDLLDATPKKIRKEHYMRANKFWCKPDVTASTEDNLNLKRYAKQLKSDVETTKKGVPVIKK